MRRAVLVLSVVCAACAMVSAVAATARGSRERKSPRKGGSKSAEREGFEPSMDETAHTGFRDRRIQPLCHLSGVGSLRG